MAKIVVIFIVFLLGLWYIAYPIPSTLYVTTPPPQAKQVLQSTNLIAYYTDNRRRFTTDYYQKAYQQLHCRYLKIINPYCYIKPLKINHSPTLAPSYLAPKQKSTYLEEYFYPLRDALIVNGYEPYDQNGEAFDKYSQPLGLDGKQYNSEVTVRYYSSSVYSRVFIYILIWACVFFEIILFRKIIKYD
jgi:hypothetical protein